MKRVITETDGKKQAFWIRDNDTTTEFGIPESIPDLDRLDWKAIKTDLHNSFVEESYSTWQDVQRRPELFQGLILAVVRNRIVSLFKITEQEVRSNE